MGVLVRFVKSNPVLLLVGLMVLLILSKMKSIITSFTESPERPVEDKMSEIGSYISKVDASNIANKLYLAMNGMGTDEEMIFHALEGLTKEDYSVVYNQFGQRRYNDASGSIGINSVFRDLNYWLNAELGNDDLMKLRDDFNLPI